MLGRAVNQEGAETSFAQGHPDQSMETGYPGQPGKLRMVYRSSRSHSYLWERPTGDSQVSQWSRVSVCQPWREGVLSRRARPGKAGNKNQTEFEVGLTLQEGT